MTKRLLILSCSKRKREDMCLLPAIERYDGPSFRVLRKFLKTRPVDNIEVLILSAKFGLISGQQLIPNYDLRMSKSQAEQWREDVSVMLRHLLNTCHYRELFLSVGKDYMPTLGEFEEWVSPYARTTIARESMGKRLTMLYGWLYGSARLLPPKAPQKPHPPSIRGVAIPQTSDEVYAIAYRAISEQNQQALKFQSWYVAVNDHRIAPKWLIHQLTGLPVNAFHTDEARRVLHDLGMEVSCA